LTQLRLLEQDGQLVVRLGDGQLVDGSGQLHFDFEDQNGNEDAAREAGTTSQGSSFTRQAPENERSIGVPRSAEEFWKKGCALEEAGRLEDAATAYREALFVGSPEVKVCFNLGNVLYGLGQLGQAVERYRQAIELDHACVEAWNN